MCLHIFGFLFFLYATVIRFAWIARTNSRTCKIEPIFIARFWKQSAIPHVHTRWNELNDPRQTVLWIFTLSGKVSNSDIFKYDETWRSIPNRALISWETRIVSCGSITLSQVKPIEHLLNQGLEAINTIGRTALAVSLVTWYKIRTISEVAVDVLRYFKRLTWFL